MLVGQDINVGYAILISIIGICVVMVELGLLSIFVRAMSKIIGNVDTNKKEDVKKVEAPVVQNTAVTSVATPIVENGNDEEIAAIMTAVLEETGFRPEEIIFKSIKAL